MEKTEVVKVRATTRDSTWTLPECPERRARFMAGDWTELHVVHEETKLLLAVYTREQVVRMMYSPSRSKKQSRSKAIVSVFNC